MVLVAMAMARQLAELGRQQEQAAAVVESAQSVSTPSGAVPVYLKGNTRSSSSKTPGAHEAHAGARRKRPPKIDTEQMHRLEACPCCGGQLQRCDRVRTRIIEDIPRQIEPVVTRHTIHRDYCPSCKKHVEPVVPDAMPKATLGHQVVALSAWFHYGLGITLAQTCQILAGHLHTAITPGGLLDAWRRMTDALSPWHERIAEQLRDTACLHADETGWRVDGQTHWLWCFCDTRSCMYLIDRSRGSPALRRFFTDAFKGTLVSDFWPVYQQVACEDQQYCLVHLLRELHKVDQHDTSTGWRGFSRKLRRLIHHGIALRKRADFTKQHYQPRITRIHHRLCKLADDATAGVYPSPDAARLGARISRHRDHLFTFLDRPEVPFENNHAERQIRPAVIMRKNILGNRSADGARVQATLMSIFRTLKLRGHPDPSGTIARALKTLLQTGQLPQLPEMNVADG